jgi:hypothetical protein
MPIRERMRAASGWARALARRAVDLFPFTFPGVLTLGGAALALVYYGWKRLDLLLLVVGVVGFALGALALLFTVIGVVGLRVHLRTRKGGEPLHLECGVPARTGISIPRLWFLPLVKVAWSWVEPEGTVRSVATGMPSLRAFRRLHEEIIPRRRALTDQIVRRVEVGDAFGLTRIAFRIREARPLQVIPAVGALKSVHVVRSIAGGEDLYDPAGTPAGERVDTRAYADGDPIRLILWKVFAKSGQLVVRTPERAYSISRKMIAYAIAGEGDEPVAGAARVAVESGALGATWVLGADGNSVDATTPAAALELLARSAACPPEQRGRGLGPFLQRVGEGPFRRAVVFVPSRPGPWIEPVLTAVRARPAVSSVGASGSAKLSPVEFVVCTDGIARDAPRSILSRLVLASSAGRGPERTKASDIAAVVRALSAARARVVVVDRFTGRVYEGALGLMMGRNGATPSATASSAAVAEPPGAAPTLGAGRSEGA